jgi:DNA-binding winged helix-turn-helix (wHTH) protein
VTDFSLSFGPFSLNPKRRVLLRNGKPLRLGSRAMDLLITLVDSGKDLISKKDLLKQVWPDTFIEEANLRVHVAALRKLLGDEGKGDQYISTVAGRGYCFVAPVTRTDEAAGDPAIASPVAEPALLTRTLARPVAKNPSGGTKTASVLCSMHRKTSSASSGSPDPPTTNTQAQPEGESNRGHTKAVR